MLGLKEILIAFILIDIALIALLTVRPSLTAKRRGKILAFVSLLVFPTIAVAMGSSEHLERSKSTEFCLSCHVMSDYGKSLQIDDRSFIPAVHYQNNLVPREKACFTCHTDYTMYGDMKSKLRGFKHVYVQYLGTVPSKPKLYSAYNNRECLHCHQGSRSFEEGATHNMDPATLPAVKAGNLSCLSSGCHESTHNVTNLKDMTFRKEAEK
jgi:cytochrome c-type protein NapC